MAWPHFFCMWFPQCGRRPSTSEKPYSSASAQVEKTRPDFSKSFGSATRFTTARPEYTGVSDSAKSGSFATALAPVDLGNAEVFEHYFRAQEPGCQGDGGHILAPEFPGKNEGHSNGRGYRQAVEEIATILVRVPVRHFDDQASA